jgi:hypothetical protein
MELVEEFAEAADLHFEAVEALDDEQANRQAGRLARLFAEIVKQGNDGREALLALVDSSNSAVAGMAAVYSLRYSPARCVALLKHLAKQPGLLGFRAGAALQRWEEGDWPIE